MQQENPEHNQKNEAADHQQPKNREEASPRVAVLGGGSFGTAIGNLLADNGASVCLWMRDAALVEEVNEEHQNTRYLPGVKLNPQLQATTNLDLAVESARVIFMAVPSSACREVLQQVAPRVLPETRFVSCTKGMEPGTSHLMSQVLQSEVSPECIAVLSGPNLAKEIAARMITGTVVASTNPAVVSQVQSLLSNGYFRVYGSPDPFSIELAGALKNIYAIASGMAASLSMGENTRAMLITRSLAEMGRLIQHLGGNPMALMGLAGIGDLIVTCSSPKSRNYRVGMAVGEGKTIEQALAGMDQTAEGVNTIRVIYELAQRDGVYMPIATGLYEILFEHKPLAEIIIKMMSADQNTDVEFGMAFE